MADGRPCCAVEEIVTGQRMAAAERALDRGRRRRRRKGGKKPAIRTTQTPRGANSTKAGPHKRARRDPGTPRGQAMRNVARLLRAQGNLTDAQIGSMLGIRADRVRDLCKPTLAEQVAELKARIGR